MSVNERQERIEKAKRISERTARTYLATADASGMPHIASAGKLTGAGEGRVAVTFWFCGQTISNLERNSRASIVSFDPRNDEGVQLSGSVDDLREAEMMDGAPSPGERDLVFPQVERRIVLKVGKTMDFSAVEKEKL